MDVDLLVRCALVTCEGLFSGETHIAHPPMSSLDTKLSIPIALPKAQKYELAVKLVLGTRFRLVIVSVVLMESCL
jgi:hypothetical protein